MNATRLAAGTILLTACAGAANADVSATITGVSDYNFRGITQTAQDPALQFGLDWEGESGLYAGFWASNVDFGICDDGGEGGSPIDCDSDIETNFILGYSGSFTEDLGYDVGGVYYKYLDDGDDIDYYELYAGASYSIVSGTFWYSPDYLNSSDSSWYADLNAEAGLGFWDLGWVAHVGYSFGDYFDNTDNFDDGEYFDWALGITRSFGKFDFELKYADGSDLSEADGTGNPPDANSSEGQFIFSIATTFPWSDE